MRPRVTATPRARTRYTTLDLIAARRSLATATIAALTILSITGCTSDAAISSSASGTSSSGSSGSETNASGSADEDASPLQAFLGQDFIDYTSDAGQAQLIEEQRRTNELIVACMAKEGFEYVPDNPDQVYAFNTVDSSGIEWGSEEYIAKYGFGITTQRWDQATVGPDLVGYDYPQSEQEYVDPNADYVASLTEAEQTAYYAALYGNDPGYVWDDTLTDEENQARADEFYADYTPTGCQAEAYNQGDQARLTEFYAEFGDELDAMYQAIMSDPRYIDAQNKVKTCVTDKGLTYVPEEDLYTKWEDTLTDIETNHVVYPGADLTEAQLAAMTPEQLDALYRQPTTMDDAGKAMLKPLQEEEIALAKAYDECGGGAQNQQDLFAGLQREYEQKFLDDNAAALAGYAGAASSGG